MISDALKQVMLFLFTALAEIVGCYLPWLVLKQQRFVDGASLTRWDIAGAAVAMVGMAIIVMQPQGT